jgi:hypothetical protein
MTVVRIISIPSLEQVSSYKDLVSKWIVTIIQLCGLREEYSYRLYLTYCNYKKPLGVLISLEGYNMCIWL